jgi:hypothetical protein
LERKIEAEKTRRFLTGQADRRRLQLALLLGDPYSGREITEMLNKCAPDERDNKEKRRQYIKPFIDRLDQIKRLYPGAGQQLAKLSGDPYSDQEIRELLKRCPSNEEDDKEKCRHYIKPFIDRLQEMKRLYFQAGMPE